VTGDPTPDTEEAQQPTEQSTGEPAAAQSAPAPEGRAGGAPEAAGGRPDQPDESGGGSGRDADQGTGQDQELDDLAAAEAEMERARADVSALTVDLQRLQAEYVNYKRRVDRDRQLVAENATFKALTPVVEVLDTIDRAREAGELEGGFKAVAEQLERAVASAGLTRFGEPGDAFDPTLHEALSHLGEEDGVEVTTVKTVAKAGYRIGDRVVRAAQVLVVDPAAAGE
jgi:molecular chaperone GrpE